MLDIEYPKVIAGPPKPSAIIEPPVFSMPPGTERHLVEGCSAILVRLEAGDKLEVENTEGGQICEIVVADPAGRYDPALIGAGQGQAASGLLALLAENPNRLRSLRLGLEARGLDLAQATAISLFDGTTAARTTENFTAQDTCVAIVAAPGGIMDFEAQDTATPLTVYVRRAVIKGLAKHVLTDKGLEQFTKDWAATGQTIL